jgi:CheY-like chemotaxis protein
MTEVAPLIFVVDDDSSVRTSLGRLLEAAGYAVETFGSAHAFLDRAPHAGPCQSSTIAHARLTGPVPEALAHRTPDGHRLPSQRRPHKRPGHGRGRSISWPSLTTSKSF